MPISQTFTPPVQPDWGYQRVSKPRVLKAEFGDGYAQRAADGINNNPLESAPRWTNLTEAEKNTIINFFDARAGYEAFLFTYEDEASAKGFVCEEWGWTHEDAAGYTVQARFREVFDV